MTHWMIKAHRSGRAAYFLDNFFSCGRRPWGACREISRRRARLAGQNLRLVTMEIVCLLARGGQRAGLLLRRAGILLLLRFFHSIGQEARGGSESEICGAAAGPRARKGWELPLVWSLNGNRTDFRVRAYDECLAGYTLVHAILDRSRKDCV